MDSPMSSDPVSIEVRDLCKCYQIYERPQDRLKQSLIPRLSRLVGRAAPTYYREFWALRDVSLQVARGETVGIVGRNGSGKSTLLQIICGTLTPTAGTVEVRGRVSALLELGAGFNPEFSGRENVLLNAAILGFPREEMVARMDQVVAFSELGDFLDQPVKTYSSGMYARLAFSAAIHVDPDVLIVDETLAVGDARFVAKCLRRIREIKEAGTTILFVSHDVASVRALCDSAIWLDKGRLIDRGHVFPVSGRYMEFIFRDEPRPDSEPRPGDQASAARDDPPGGSAPVLAGGEGARVPVAGSGAQEMGEGGNPAPVTHWGSHRGLILSASVRDGEGVRRDLVRWSSPIEVLIELRVPRAIPRDDLSVSFSIKDLKGTDLIVSTTRDFGSRRLPEAERFRISFRFINPLVTGKYLLVAAVENRKHRDIHYYEYLEGAHYFSSLSDQSFFGLFQPAIEQRIQSNEMAS
mgnify:CR=1 FL=1